MENQNENIGEPIPPCCHEKSNSAGKIISVAALIIFAFIASYAYTKNSFPVAPAPRLWHRLWAITCRFTRRGGDSFRWGRDSDAWGDLGKK